ncbi:hypothetical protein [Streptomyces litchfieldiae]|uniref:Uncharacterized protein n=1 Tax=Streptomyces litchfieldiae TaxID=3075543 RepID=A0ABU2MQI1_9ACTN|nr:hypothetical protein [Streptomyces sp. DSM 44938]MDT0343163.1 hypothetical protein [Streptomyces sp. DSM 44938]
MSKTRKILMVCAAALALGLGSTPALAASDTDVAPAASLPGDSWSSSAPLGR